MSRAADRTRTCYPAPDRAGAERAASKRLDGRRDWGQAFASHAEFYRAVYGAHIGSLVSLGSFGASLLEAQQPAGDWSDAPTPDLTIAWLASPTAGAAIDLGAGRFATRMRRGDTILIAPNAGAAIEMEDLHLCRGLSLPYARLLDLVGGPEAGMPPDGDFGPLHAGTLRNDALADALERLWAEVEAGAPHGALYADGAILQVAAVLQSLMRGAANPSADARGGLSTWRERRVVEYLEARLAEDMSLAELSAVAGLSPNHFCTAFRITMGEPPHRWLLRRRIERARDLLADPRLTITDVALSVGFGSSAHFATAFRKLVGATPSAYRRGRLP
jgi:AraC family transcriptional regulator